MTDLKSSNFFIVATELLKAPGKPWSSGGFQKQGVTKNVASSILRILEKKDVVEWAGGRRRGRGAYCVLRTPEMLLRQCVENFMDQDLRRESFVSNRSAEEIALALQEKGYEVFLGRFEGLPKEYRYVHDGRGEILCLNSKIFTLANRERLIWELSLHHVSKGGNIFISIPRHKKFLKYQTLEQDGVKIPSLFYTYLSLKNWDYPMAQAQIEHLEKCLKKEGKFFVQGMGLVKTMNSRVLLKITKKRHPRENGDPGAQ